MRLGAERIAASLKAAGINDADVTVQPLGVVCRVRGPRVVAVLGALKAADYGALVDLFGTDVGSRIEITYHLRCLEDRREVYVRTRVGYDAVAKSVAEVFPAATYAEREVAELFGLTFAGNPDMRRLLTTSEVPDPLLRKSVPLGRAAGPQ